MDPISRGSGRPSTLPSQVSRHDPIAPVGLQKSWLEAAKEQLHRGSQRAGLFLRHSYFVDRGDRFLKGHYFHAVYRTQVYRVGTSIHFVRTNGKTGEDISFKDLSEANIRSALRSIQDTWQDHSVFGIIKTTIAVLALALPDIQETMPDLADEVFAVLTQIASDPSRPLIERILALEAEPVRKKATKDSALVRQWTQLQFQNKNIRRPHFLNHYEENKDLDKALYEPAKPPVVLTPQQQRENKISAMTFAMGAMVLHHLPVAWIITKELVSIPDHLTQGLILFGVPILSIAIFYTVFLKLLAPAKPMAVSHKIKTLSEKIETLQTHIKKLNEGIVANYDPERTKILQTMKAYLDAKLSRCQQALEAHQAS